MKNIYINRRVIGMDNCIQRSDILFVSWKAEVTAASPKKLQTYANRFYRIF